MNESQLSRLSDAYLASLRAHCAQAPLGTPQAAHEIGRKAVASGLETLDLARIHDRALIQLLGVRDTTATQTDLIARSAAFFTEAITVIEETHHAALKTAEDLGELHVALDQRTLDLADANQEIQRQAAERSVAEAALRDSQQSSGQLLKDSRVLENQLQEMTRQILSATEIERQKMSRQLNDEIAQTLLGIHVRILALKNGVATNHAALTREIAATQQLVIAATKTMNHLVNQFSNPHAQ